MATATNLSSSEASRIENPHARRGGFGFAAGSPCRSCGRRFPTAKARRRHERRAHERAPSSGTHLEGATVPPAAGETPDPLDNPGLKGDALRGAARRRLRYLAGFSEER
jgi:hypothetical protein